MVPGLVMGVCQRDALVPGLEISSRERLQIKLMHIDEETSRSKWNGERWMSGMGRGAHSVEQVVAHDGLELRLFAGDHVHHREDPLGQPLRVVGRQVEAPDDDGQVEAELLGHGAQELEGDAGNKERVQCLGDTPKTVDSAAKHLRGPLPGHMTGLGVRGEGSPQRHVGREPKTC